MEAKQIYLFPLIIFFLLLSSFSLQALSSPTITEKNNTVLEKKKKSVIEDLLKVVGPPNYAASDHAEYMLRVVGLILEMKNWKYNSSGEEKPNAKAFQSAKAKAHIVIISWIIGPMRPLNPYRSYGDILFYYIFYQIEQMERENPVYPCFKAVWPSCMARAPATPEGEMVYRFECAWRFNEKCGKRPPINGAHFGSQT